MTNESIRASLVKIGNSQGVRIPKTLLTISGIENDVEIAVTKGAITIRPARKARENWAEQFEAMALNGDDSLLDDHVLTEWDKEEWNW